MKKLLWLSSVAVFFILASTAGAAGFRDLNWGDNLTNIKGMKHIGTDFGYGGGIELYVRPADALNVGGAKVDIIVYKFWNNKLFGVSIMLTDFANYKALKEMIQKKSGKGWKYNSFMESYLWLGPPTRMHLEFNKAAGKGRLAMYSSDLVVEAETAREKKAKQLNFTN